MNKGTSWYPFATPRLAGDIYSVSSCRWRRCKRQISLVQLRSSQGVSVNLHPGRSGIKIRHLAWRDTASASLISPVLSGSYIYQDYSLLRQVISVKLEWLFSRGTERHAS